MGGGRRRTDAGPTPVRRAPRRPGRSDRQALSALIDEVAALRLTLTTDLTVAAAALDTGDPRVARDVVEEDRAEVRRFGMRAMDRIAVLAATEETGAPAPLLDAPPAPRSTPGPSRRAPAIVAAAAAAALAVALVPAVAHHRTPTLSLGPPLAASWQAFTQAAAVTPGSRAVVTAAESLHHSMERLLPAARNDPGEARQLLRMLAAEQLVLLREHPADFAVVLAQARELADQLLSVLTGAAGQKVPSPTPLPVLVPTSPSSPKNSSSPRPTPSSSSSTPRQSSSPSPSPSHSTSPQPTPSNSLGFDGLFGH
jgi:hypothetical protein